jgi:hypothetical protein
MTIVLDIDDPEFLSRGHHSSGQKVFYTLEFSALQLLNTNMYVINGIPSYLIVVRRYSIRHYLPQAVRRCVPNDLHKTQLSFPFNTTGW